MESVIEKLQIQTVRIEEFLQLKENNKKGIYSLEDYVHTQKSQQPFTGSLSKEVEMHIRELELRINKQMDSKTRQIMDVEKQVMQIPEIRTQIALLSREINTRAMSSTVSLLELKLQKYAFQTDLEDLKIKLDTKTSVTAYQNLQQLVAKLEQNLLRTDDGIVHANKRYEEYVKMMSQQIREIKSSIQEQKIWTLTQMQEVEKNFH